MLLAAELAWKADKPPRHLQDGDGQKVRKQPLSHTGSLAGLAEAYAAGFARVEAPLQVDKLEALVNAKSFFHKNRETEGPRRSRDRRTSGGATIIAAGQGGGAMTWPLPQPGPEAAAVLAREVPEYGSTRNPCDVTAQVISSVAALGACINRPHFPILSSA